MKLTRTVSVLAVVTALLAAGCEKTSSETPASTPAATSKASAVATPATTKASETSGVPECDAYLAAVEKYLNCANVPQAARDAQAQSAKQMRASMASWATLPEDARKMAQATSKASCTTALIALKQAASATGCPVE